MWEDWGTDFQLVYNSLGGEMRLILGNSIRNEAMALVLLSGDTRT